MGKELSLLILAGDGVGPEVMRETRRVIDWLGQNRALEFVIQEDLIGGAAYDAYGQPLGRDTLAMAKDVGAILLGAVGGPKWADVDFNHRPEAALLNLRKGLGLFANLRPIICFEPLVEASSLKADVIRGLDIMIVHELTGGIYYGTPRGIEQSEEGGYRGTNTQVYTCGAIHRIGQVAFELAEKRHGRLTSCDKSDALETGLLWRQEMTKMSQDHKDVTLTHMLAETCAMQLIRAPKQFDVIVTDNLLGDLLSGGATMATGSVGMMPSASFGPNGGGDLYSPVHGSAPDIAGRNIANPIGTILSLALALRYTYDRDSEAQLIEDAILAVLAGGLRTADIMQPGKARVSTSVMGDSILGQLDRLNS